VKKMQRKEKSKEKPREQAVVGVMFDALVCLEEKLLALQTHDDFDREILAIIAPALNAARGVSKSHLTDLEVQS
jgi:hypothetical protein